MAAAVQPETPEELAEEVQGLSGKQLKYLAEVAKHDLYVMCKGVLGYEDLMPEAHKAFCAFAQNDEISKKRRMGLMPRMHLKSSIWTIGNNTRLAVKFPKTFRGLIVGETDTTATNFLREIKNHWEVESSLLRVLYPELVPERWSGPGSDWSSSRASLNNQSVFREATWQAIGVGGAIVGSHFSRITCDDIIGLEAAESKAEMERVKRWVENIDPLLTNAIEDIIDFVGTRWGRHDVYAHIMKLYGEDILVFRREAIENGAPIFPRKHSLETLAQIQKIPRVWFAQYCNNPLAEGQTDFPRNALRTFRLGNDRDVVATKDGQELRWRRDELDVIITVDPNSGSKTAEDDAAIIVSGMSPDEDIFVLETWSGKPTPSELVDLVFERYKKWHPRVVGIERAGQQTTQHYFEKKMKEEKMYVNVVPLQPKSREKGYRIRTAVEPILASRRLFLLPSQTALRTQIEFFPDNDLVDELDALAYGAEEGMWRAPDRFEDQEEKTDALELLRGRRSLRTGY